MIKSSEDQPNVRFSNVLVATDLTNAADRVLGRVGFLPLGPGARVTLLHVIPINLPVPARRRAEIEAKKAMNEEALYLANSLPKEVSVVPMLTVGAPAAEIASRAAEIHAELVILGRGDGESLTDTFLGSTAERVLRRAQLPILVVRLAPREAYRRPALAVDIDQAAAPALGQLLKVLPSSRVHIDVIHADDPPYQGLKYSIYAEDEGDAVGLGHERATAQQLGLLLTAALATVNVPAADAPVWQTHIHVGTPRSVIPKAVRKAETDLLVLGTRGNSGLAFAFLGSVAGDVLRAVSCDVLVVPPAESEAGS